MSIYVIADLHLSFSQDKPMDIFGKNWENHAEKIKQDWLAKVNDDDMVVLPGDFSWAMHLEDTYLDFKYLNELPGKKVLLKGNHDYWWTTVTSMKKFLEENKFNNIEFLYNNAIGYENKVFVGSRGWALQDTENSKKMINRECQRLELSIKDAINNYDNTKEIIAVLVQIENLIIKLKNDELNKRIFIKKSMEELHYGEIYRNT